MSTLKRRRSRHPGIRQLTSGSWQVLFRDPSGRQRARSFPTLRDAKAFQDATRADLRRGAWIDPAGGEIRFGEWAALWLEMKPLRPTTAAARESRLRTHLLPAFGEVPLGRISNLAVQSWVRELERAGLARETVRSCYRLLCQILHAATDEDLIGKSPCRKVTFDPSAPPGRKPRALATGDAARLLSSLQQPWQTLVLVLLSTGLRWGEAAGLRRRNVHLLRRPPTVEVVEALHEVNGRRFFEAPKTAAAVRVAPLCAAAAHALAAHLPPNGDPADPVFVGARGALLSRVRFRQRVWLPALERAGLEGLHVHDLRHTYASWLEDGGIPRAAISELLGHSGGGHVTGRYVHALPEVVGRVVAVLDERLGAAEVGAGVGG